MSRSDCLSLPWSPSGAHTSVLLVRHGRTAWNRDRKFLGLTDIELDDHGRVQVSRLESLSSLTTQIWSSPLRRAIQTARAISDSVAADSAWRELDQGHLEGMLPMEAVAAFPEFFKQFQADPGGTCVPGGESMGQRVREAREALDLLRKRGGVHVVVTHQMVIAGVRCMIAEGSLDGWRSYCVANASVSVLEDHGPGWVECVGGWVPIGPDADDV